MDISMFVNKEYMMHTYNMDDSLLNRFINEVLPNLVNRLSMDHRVESIVIFSNDALGANLGFGSKVRQSKIGSSSDSSYSSLISLALRESGKTDVMTVYNPLFPFISVDKIHMAYTSVKEGTSSSAIGLDHYYAKSFRDDFAEMFDAGMFSVFKKSNFRSNGLRIHPPTKGIKLGALELISLRELEDYDLYGLVVNSGLM